ncbi:MAG: ATP-grasp domain-containing protein [Candidatus Tantalella remota]|nr:ATP-grasp domain-containing protein [Candidatus Tantalella remota]
MKNTGAYLRKKYGRWGWMGQRTHDADGINRVLPLDFVISCDHGAEIPYFFREEDVFSVEKEGKIRRDWSNEDLKTSLNGSIGRRVFDRFNSYSEGINLLCYRSVRKLERPGGKLQRVPRIYAMPEKLKRHFDNKLLLRRNLAALSLPQIPGFIERPGRITFDRLRKELSLPFVVQFPYGSSGSSTFIIRREKGYDALVRSHPEDQAVMSRYIDGFSLNMNAVTVSRGSGVKVFASVPSVQITGIPECSNFESTFCGNDYAAAKWVDKGIVKDVQSQIKVVGEWMAEKGFRGVFGMDFMVTGGKVYPVEINPRFQNSTSLYTVLSTIAKSCRWTPFMLHIAEFLQAEDEVMRKYASGFPEDGLMCPVKGSQVILHNKMKRRRVTGELEPGIYRSDGGELSFVRHAASLADCESERDILITCGVPGKGTVVEPNAPVCKVQLLKNIIDPSNLQYLTAEGREIVKDVYRKLNLKTVRKTEMAGAA